jgi:hypothetical protein
MHPTRWNRIVPAALLLVLVAGAWYRGAGLRGDPLQAGAPAAESLAVPVQPATQADGGWLFGTPSSSMTDGGAGEDLAQQVQRLSASREPRDAYQAYRLLRACMDTQHQPLQVAAIGAVADGRSGLAGVADPVAFCGAMTERMRTDRIALLERAARAGVDGAMVALVEEGPYGDASALATRPDDPLVTEWKARIGQMLGEQAGQGDWASLYLLFTGFAFGNPAIAVDRQSALAYGLALRDIVVRLDGLTEDQAIPFNGPFLDQVKAGLSPEQQSRAAAQAAGIVDAAVRQRGQGRQAGT